MQANVQQKIEHVRKEIISEKILCRYLYYQKSINKFYAACVNLWKSPNKIESTQKNERLNAEWNKTSLKN